MNRVIVDPITREKLAGVRKKLELWDDSGYLLGHFIPVDDRREPQISAEEIERRLRSGGGRSLAEILADLEKKA